MKWYSKKQMSYLSQLLMALVFTFGMHSVVGSDQPTAEEKKAIQESLNPSVISGEGRITGLNFGKQVAEISGLTFKIPLDAKIEINNSFGAFTLLKKEMIVSFKYNESIDSSGRKTRTILELKQLSDDYPLIEL